VSPCSCPTPSGSSSSWASWTGTLSSGSCSTSAWPPWPPALTHRCTPHPVPTTEASQACTRQSASGRGGRIQRRPTRLSCATVDLGSDMIPGDSPPHDAPRFIGAEVLIRAVVRGRLADIVDRGHVRGRRLGRLLCRGIRGDASGARGGERGGTGGKKCGRLCGRRGGHARLGRRKHRGEASGPLRRANGWAVGGNLGRS
jgi:hypothetical protein